MDSTIYSKVFVLINILIGNVLRNHLVGDVAGTAAEVPPGPQVPSPELHVVLGYVPLHDLHLVLTADVPDQITHPRGHLAAQGRASIFRYPDQMPMDLENGMRAGSLPSFQLNLRRAC